LWQTTISFCLRRRNILLSLIQQHPRGITLNNLSAISSLKNTSSIVHNLQLAGWVKIQARQTRQLAARTEKICAPGR